MQIVDANTVSLQATWTEPAILPGGNPLAYYYISYVIGSAAPVLGPHVPASATGNQTVTTTLMLPAPSGASTTAVFTVFAVDTIGQVSAGSNTATVTVNRIVPPAPINFTIG
jgi:hypothetical protein